MRRLGILGGTFDPIHNGHLVLASEACAQRNLDAVILVPAGDPWQKSSVVASSTDRLAMLYCAVEGRDDLLVSNADMEREGPSYAIDTIRDLRSGYPNTEFEFIVGSDALAGIPTWNSFDELVEAVTFVAAQRPGTPFVVPDRVKATAIAVPQLEISSTAIRTRVQEGRSIAFLVPEGVEEYIYSSGLYLSS